MPDVFDYEHGARQTVERTWPDPIDDFSQDAASNPPPKRPAPKSGRKQPQPAKQDNADEPEPAQPRPARDTHDTPARNPGGRTQHAPPP
ncbi:hypothetical protein BZU93_30455 [Salmonella enterica subsp. enterica]|nr:hypothetical protein [Salmonella enterica subsp. enterica serovar Enteritidis]